MAKYDAGLPIRNLQAVDVSAIRNIEALGATEIAKRLKIGRASVYRVLAAAN